MWHPRVQIDVSFIVHTQSLSRRQSHADDQVIRFVASLGDGVETQRRLRRDPDLPPDSEAESCEPARIERAVFALSQESHLRAEGTPEPADEAFCVVGGSG